MLPTSVLVTGANRGIGLEIVRQLVVAGGSLNIFATYRKAEDCVELFELAEKTSVSSTAVRPIQLDVCDESSYPDVVKQVSSVLGDASTGSGLNALIHNAGVLRRPGDLSSSSKSEFLEAYEVNAVAPVLLTRAFLPLLKLAAENRSDSTTEFSWTRSSVIVISALWGSPSFNTQGGIPYAYGMSKAAVNFATKSLSFDLKPHKILTVALHPGWVKTRMGGDEAPVELAVSVRNMLELALPKMNEASTGGFFDSNGRPLKY